MLVASVAVEKTSFVYDRLFDYVIPEEFVLDVFVGSFVLIPFGTTNLEKQAVVFKIKEEDETLGLKKILKVLSFEIVLTKELLDVAKFLHSRCFCSWFDTIRAVLPTGFFYGFNTVWSLNVENVSKCSLNEEEKSLFLKLKEFKSKTCLNSNIRKLLLEQEFKNIIKSLIKKKILVENKHIKRKIVNKDVAMVCATERCYEKITKKQKIFLDYVKEQSEVSLKKACYYCGVTTTVAKNLQKLGLIKVFEKHVYNNVYDDVEKTKYAEDVVLNEEQDVAFKGILDILKTGKFSIALLKGVTGSGKTQIFLKLIDYVLKSGKDCIFLVPEISLTVQLVRNLQNFFGKCVAIMHSGISASQQVDGYLKIFNGEGKLVVGTRSAIFAPCKNLGLIIMDEEEGTYYKNSEMAPRYDAKDVAKFRAFNSSCLLLLSSATPSITTNFFACKGIYKKFVLKKRYGKVNLPKVFVVNMLKTRMSKICGVSVHLYNELLENIKKKEQSIVFLNRRGYYLNLICLGCGSGLKCERCSALMIYHKVNNTFMCHHCGYIKYEVKVCSVCGANKLSFCGQGTQKIEEQFKENFNGVRILRLDRDSAFTRKDLEEKIKRFEEGEYDILIGTQLIAKGLNFLNVSLVGVLAIDGVLFGTDYKSSERAFSLLTQVIGRSGRAKKQGRAIIQTYNPFNKVISWAAKQDYEVFYKNEILERKEFFCPPFCDICVVNFIGNDEKKLLVCAEKFILECKLKADRKIPFKLLGISTPYLEMINKKYKKRIIIKCKNSKSFRNWIRNVALEVFSLKIFKQVRANIDMNGEIL